MGSRVRIRLFHILHFVRDLLFPLLKNSKSGVHDRGHRLRFIHALEEGSKGHIICACAQDCSWLACLCNYFSLILCLFETYSKEKPSALSCIQVQMLLYSVNVFFRQELKLGHCDDDDVRSLGLLSQDTD